MFMAKSSLVMPKFPKFVMILGVPWKIQVLTHEEEPSFKSDHCDGLCYLNGRTIKILNSVSAYKDESQEFHDDYMREVLRHEIVHAFLYESGLGSSSIKYPAPWAKNEEMVDWFAHQGQKIYEAWEFCGCLKIISPERWMEIEEDKKQNARKKP